MGVVQIWERFEELGNFVHASKQARRKKLLQLLASAVEEEVGGGDTHHLLLQPASPVWLCSTTVCVPASCTKTVAGVRHF